MSAMAPELAIALAPVRDVLDDEATEDLAFNGPGVGWRLAHGRWERIDAPAMTFGRLRGVATLAAASTRKGINARSPLLAAELPTGHRLQVVLPPAVPLGTISLTFRRSSDDVSPVESVTSRFQTAGWNDWAQREAGGARGTADLLHCFDAGDLEGFLRGLAATRRSPLFCGPTGAGKAQPLDAKVLTPTGWRMMGDLAAGDLVTCPDGKVAPITGVFPQGEKDIYRVTFEDGRSAECCDDHLWKVWHWHHAKEAGKMHSTRKTISHGFWEILPLRQIRSWFDKGQLKAGRAGVPLVTPCAIEQPPQSLPIPPYALGALLGDGCFKNSIFLSTADQYILQRVISDLPLYEVGAQDRYDYCLKLKRPIGPKLAPLQVALDSLGLRFARSQNKFVPEIYKRGSVAQRIAMLQGLMDTDGSAEGRGTYATFTSTSERLAKDVQEIAWSLGAIAKISPRQTHYTNKHGVHTAGKPSWRVSMTHSDIASFFSLPRKVARCKAKPGEPRLRIASVELVGRKPAKCISVEHPEGLYVTDNFVVTHNTGKLKTFLSLLPLEARIITIEDALEAVLRQKNVVRLQYAANGAGGVTQAALLKASLRMRPDYIVCGEMRDPDAALSYVNECMTGHPGAPATLHGQTAAAAARRLFNLVKGSEDGRSMSDASVTALLGACVDVIIPIGNVGGVRSVEAVWFADDAWRRGETFADLLCEH